jgi:hypothetical protein
MVQGIVCNVFRADIDVHLDISSITAAPSGRL